MGSGEEVESAEARMNAAREALLSYIERVKKIDRDQYGRLVARVKKAEGEFMKAIAELDR